MEKPNIKKLYKRIMMVIIASVMVLSFIEMLYLVTILMGFLLLMFVKPIRVWLMTPDKM